MKRHRESVYKGGARHRDLGLDAGPDVSNLTLGKSASMPYVPHPSRAADVHSSASHYGGAQLGSQPLAVPKKYPAIASH